MARGKMTVHKGFICFCVSGVPFVCLSESVSDFKEHFLCTLAGMETLEWCLREKTVKSSFSCNLTRAYASLNALR